MSRHKKPKLCNPLLGFQDKQTVKIDCDGWPFKKVKYWAGRTMEWFKLGGYLIAKSSEKHYHIVFNRFVTWSKNLSIINWVAQQSKSRKLDGYCIMQAIKENSTLRISKKQGKPTPIIVFRYGKQDKGIKKYLQCREELKPTLEMIDNYAPLP